MDEYEGMQDMSPEADDDEAEDRCPVPDDSDSDSGESDVDLAVPQNRGAEVAGGAGGAVRLRDDEDSDVASLRGVYLAKFDFCQLGANNIAC